MSESDRTNFYDENTPLGQRINELFFIIKALFSARSGLYIKGIKKNVVEF